MNIYETFTKYSNKFRCVSQSENQTSIEADGYPIISIEIPNNEHMFYLVRIDCTDTWVHWVNLLSKREKLSLDAVCKLIIHHTIKYLNHTHNSFAIEQEIRNNKSNCNEYLINEFMNTINHNNAGRDTIEIRLDNQSTSSWIITMSNFNNRAITQDISINMTFDQSSYPTTPPIITSIMPQMANSLNIRIINIDLIRKQHWTRGRSIKFIIDKIYDIIETRGKFVTKTYFNQIIDDTINQIISISGIVSALEMTDNVTSPKDSIQNKSNGTGYFSKSQWDMKEYLLEQTNKRQKLLQLTDILIHEFSQNPEVITKWNEISLQLIDSEIIQCFLDILDDMTPTTLETDSKLYENVLNLLLSISYENYMKMNEYSLNGLRTSLGRVKTYLGKMDHKLNLPPNAVEFYKQLMTVKPEISAPTDTIDQEKLYIGRMSKFRFGEDDILSHGYYKEYISNNKLHPQAVKRLSGELTSLSVDLPINKTSSIFMRVDPTNMSVLRVMIIGPKDTPYENGCFIFDIMIPSNYPNEHPLIQFRNHGGVRFNPNLYACGKVCLSLIGTWGDRSKSNSENWQPASSTIFQLLLSIQSQIMVEKPMFNEPAYYGMEYKLVNDSIQYNRNIEYYTLLHAINDVIANRAQYGDFAETIVEHFKLNASEIKNKYATTYRDTDKTAYGRCEKLLDSLQ